MTSVVSYSKSVELPGHLFVEYIVGIPGLEPRTSASETDVLTNYTHIPILFVVQVGIEPTVAVKVMILKTLFNPRLLSPILKGFFCTILSG